MGSNRGKIKVGADILSEKDFKLLKGKRIGLITNHSAYLSNGVHLADALYENKDIKIMSFFGPEHGIRGDSPDGMKISHEEDPKTKIKIYSLYGKINKPTPDMLEGIDLLVYDIQDIGARFYTYISTLFLTMEAAAENNIDYVILDRPNPITGLRIEGPVLDPEFKSFVGLVPIPVIHGMTIGELGMLVNSEGWLDGGLKANLTVIKMEGWNRSLWYDDTGLEWIKPSPNMTSIKTAIIYPGTCFFEGTNISEGRGTNHPFELVGAPFIDGKLLAEEMNKFNLPGVVFKPVHFTPKNINKITNKPKYVSEKCSGIFIEIINGNIYEPVKVAMYLLSKIKEMYPDDFNWRPRSKSTGHYYIDLLSGTDVIRKMIDDGNEPEKIYSNSSFDVKDFLQKREKYLLYD